MAGNSSIEWTDSTWNPIRGCSRVSPGCQHCYAEEIAYHFSGEGLPYHGLARKTPKGAQWTNKTMIVEHVMDQPIRWRKPLNIFVNSMSDMFHKGISEADILRIYNTMCVADHHNFQILTKRSERLAELAPRLPWQKNIWIGVSVENADYLHRLDDLRTVPTDNRFVSAEPLLGPLGDMNLDCIAWVIAGGESGKGCRPCEADWFREIRDLCSYTGTMFHFKQWGGYPKKDFGRELDGRTHDDVPALLGRRSDPPNSRIALNNNERHSLSSIPSD